MNWWRRRTLHLPLYCDDSVSIEETVIDESKAKHEEVISSFNTCITWAEKNRAEFNTLHTLRLMREQAVEAKQVKCQPATILDIFNQIICLYTHICCTYICYMFYNPFSY